MQKVLKVINKKHCKDQPDKPKRRVLSYVLKPQGVQRDMPMHQAIRIMRYLIHLLAISGSGNRIHLPMSLFQLGALCTCVIPRRINSLTLLSTFLNTLQTTS